MSGYDLDASGVFNRQVFYPQVQGGAYKVNVSETY